MNQLEPWFKLFSREQILILKSENYFQKTDEILEEVFKFLGLKPIKIKDTRSLTSKAKRFFSASLKRKKEMLRQAFLNKQCKIIEGKYKYEKMKPKTREKLKKHFKESNEKLVQLLGEEFRWD